MGNARADGVHLSARPFQTDSGFQQSDCAEPVKITGHVLRFKYQRTKNLRIRAIKGAAFGKHADDDMRLAVERDDAPYNFRIGTELRNPKGMAQNGHSVLAGLVFIGGERAAEDRFYSQNVESVCRHSGAPQLNRIGPARECYRAACAGRHVLENRVLPLPVQKVKRGNSVPRVRISRRLLQNAHDPIRIRVRQRLQKNAIYKTENGRVGAYSNCKRKERHGREPGALLRHAQRISNVLQQFVHTYPLDNIRINC
jgi:hypothetical protein